MRVLQIMPSAVVMAVGASAVQAGLVTWEFAGEITSVDDQNDLLGGQVSVGSPFSGSFTFETTRARLGRG